MVKFLLYNLNWLLKCSVGIDEAIAAGDWEAAAEIALESGDPARAAELFSKVWAWEKAVQAFLLANRPTEALKAAIETRNNETINRCLSEISGESQLTTAHQTLKSKRFFAMAGAVASKLRDFKEAGECYKAEGLLLLAAQAFVKAELPREAGICAENYLRSATEPEGIATAHALIGKILFAQSAFDGAIAHFQACETSDAVFATISSMLVIALFRSGLPEAARHVLVKARLLDDSLPPTVDELLESQKHNKVETADEVIIGRYQVIKELGSGGAGEVLLVEDTLLNRQVALKRFHGSLGSSGDAYERFSREVAISKRLAHPNIVPVFDVHPQAGIYAMEHQEHGTLLDIDRSQLSETSVKKIMLDVLAGLQAAHYAGVVHRDLKPANVFLTSTGGAKIGDFGVAHLLDLGATQTGGLIGSLAYMSPEQITGADIGIEADYYALGVTLYQLITGHLPFAGPDFIAEHLTKVPLPPSSYGVDSKWDDIILPLLEKDPKQRAKAASNFSQAIKQLQTSQAILPVREQVSLDESETSQTDMSQPRYQVVSQLPSSGTNVLLQAVDTVLSRTVIIEETQIDSAKEKWFRISSPFVQRALSNKNGQVIYEAPQGTPLRNLLDKLSKRQRLRIAKRLCRAHISAEAAGSSFQGISISQVLISEDGYPTILIAGTAVPVPTSRFEIILTLVPDVDTSVDKSATEVYRRLEQLELDYLDIMTTK